MVAIPSKWVRIDSTAGTVSVRGKHGRFKGRRHIGGRGDGTHITRASRDIDLDKNGTIDIFGGEFLGRSDASGSRFLGRPIIVRASRRSRSFERRV